MKNKNGLIGIGVGAVILLILVSSMLVRIDPGLAGVVFKPFSSGLQKDNVFTAGYHVVLPWNDMIIYDVRELKSEETMDVLDKSGLSVSVDISVRYRPMQKKIGYLHEEIGKGYQAILVVPEVRSSVRQVAGRYNAEEIYSTRRQEVEEAIITETAAVLSKNNIQMTALLIRSIQLPTEIKNAIEQKLRAEQESLQMKFVLEKETQIADQKRIAAQGESDANKIINSSLTDQLLRMRGIEATLNLAESPNSKVVVVGGGKDGLPLILGNN
ncbi:MAG: prohibitin family protein [Bacteroidales bacterium]|nr:prohibitin family protein [Bacteroidales bacterium]